MLVVRLGMTSAARFSVADMRIGEFAQRAGATTRALRYYEARGLLRARRGSNGYRAYDETELLVVREIRSLQEVGFGLDEIRPFVACLRAGNASGDVCPDSVAVLRRKLAEVDGCLDRLTDIRSRLREQLDHALRDETCLTQMCS
jgi:DNA-binding transcriptional MerR regulator